MYSTAPKPSPHDSNSAPLAGEYYCFYAAVIYFVFHGSGHSGILKCRHYFCLAPTVVDDGGGVVEQVQAGKELNWMPQTECTVVANVIRVNYLFANIFVFMPSYLL